MSDYAFRFGGIARLYGVAGLQRLQRARVMVVGIGGVGSWTVEALARSGVGHLILVDLDEVCVSNINRQAPALDTTLGRAKADVMAERTRAIHGDTRVDVHLEFFTESSAHRLLGLEPGATERPDVVVDAIDSVANKARLIALCHSAKIPLVVCGGAGGRCDPTAVRVADLARVTHDRLLSEVRKRLRRDHGFPRNDRQFGVECVCSAETPRFPAPDGTVCEQRPDSEPGESLRLNCDSGFGSASFVTGAFGFAAAARAVSRIAAEPAVGTA